MTTTTTNNNNNCNKLDNLNNISAYDYYAFYMRISRFFSTIWIFFTLCFTILILIVFFSPNWIGDTYQSSNRGYFGLFSFCTRNRLTSAYTCFGDWTDFSTFPSDSAAIKTTCILVGMSCLLSILSILVTILCFIVKYERIFHVCAWIQCLCSKLKTKTYLSNICYIA